MWTILTDNYYACTMFPPCFVFHPSPSTLHLPPSTFHLPLTSSFLPPFALTLLLVPPLSLPLPFALRPPCSSFPPSSSSPGKWKDYPVGITGYSYLFGAVYMGLACLYFVMVGRGQEFKLPSKVSFVTLVYQARPSPSTLLKVSEVCGGWSSLIN